MCMSVSRVDTDFSQLFEEIPSNAAREFSGKFYTAINIIGLENA